MRKTTLSKVNGQSKVNGSIPKSVLVRNTMDIITDRGYSFDDCLDKCEKATSQELMQFLRTYDLAGDDYLLIIDNFMIEYDKEV